VIDLWAKTWRAALAATFLALAATPAAAQQNVADIRGELGALSRQIQEIRAALVATGPARGLPQDPATALQRVDQLEETLRRLTNRVDVLANDLERAVREASNRVEDIEFRLTELEGGDPSLLGRGDQLGGGLSQPTIPPVAAIAPPVAAAPTEPAAPAVAAPSGFPASAAAPADAPQLAVGEKADFEAAREAYEAGRHGEAIRLFEAFLVAYPVGPFSGEAQHLKAEALAAQGDHREAARSYLNTFSGAPDAPTAPKALHGLAVSLAELGQREEACLTLAEVDIRYPGSPVASDVAESRRSIGCR
jgi:tol-pal system protein YbgF